MVYLLYSKNKILMTQRRLHELTTVTFDDQSMTYRSSIVTVLISIHIMTDQIFLLVSKTFACSSIGYEEN